MVVHCNNITITIHPAVYKPNQAFDFISGPLRAIRNSEVGHIISARRNAVVLNGVGHAELHCAEDGVILQRK